MKMMKRGALLMLTVIMMSVGYGCSYDGRKEQPDVTGPDKRTTSGKGVMPYASDKNTASTDLADNEQQNAEATDQTGGSDFAKTGDMDSNQEDDAEKQKITLLQGPSLPKPITAYVTEEMLQNAIPAEGNLARLAAAMRKAQNGEEITVGVIGGSITQGSSATNNRNSYANLFFEWWVQAFPQAKVNFVNAGIGATNSYLGVHRVDQQLLVKQPDVVIVEFSVNDSDTAFYKASYEDLVRKILKAENNPAVILLFMTMEDGTSAEPSHMHIGFLYDLPRISYRQAVLKEIEKGTFTWKDISPDDIHPNDKGHAIVGELLWDYLNYVYAKLDTITEEVKPLTVKPLFTEAYKDAVLLNSEMITPVCMGSFGKGKGYGWFQKCWNTSGGYEPIVFEMEAQNIGILYYRTTDGLSGQFEVYIDGKFNRTLDADFSDGWGNYAESIEVFRSKVRDRHTIEIRKAKASKGDVFCILGLLIS
jgi:lysophospholipase L1-like esterase